MAVETTYHSTLVHHFLQNSAQRYPDKIALVHGSVRVSYGQILRMANALAAHLNDWGVRSGECVGIMLENSLEYVVSYYAALIAGGVAVPLSPGMQNPALGAIIREIEPKAIIAAPRCAATLAQSDPVSQIHLVMSGAAACAGDRFLRHEWQELIETGHSASIAPVGSRDLASIIYTSGSTGNPKGVMLTHGNIVANTRSICESLRLGAEDVQMIVLPFFYVMGKSLLNTHFAVGGRVVINNQFAFPAAVIRQMAQESVTGFSGVPSTFAYLIHRSPLADYRDKLPHLRYCSQAGGHMPRPLKQTLRTILPSHTDIYIMYGATEASARLTCLDPARFSEKIDSIGAPIPGVTMRVIDENGKELEPGETGEMVARGDNIMKGYWRDPVLTSKVLDDHGYHTGDLGYMDSEGFLYLVGRKDHLLKVGGHRINPLEIEEIIMSSQMVIEVAVIGVPDPLLGTKLTALAVAVSDGVTVDSVLKFCTQKLPRHKIPAALKFVQSLPKKESGKIAREACMTMVS